MPAHKKDKILSNLERQQRMRLKRKEEGRILFQTYIKQSWKKAFKSLKNSLEWRDERNEIRIPIKPGEKK